LAERPVLIPFQTYIRSITGSLPTLVKGLEASPVVNQTQLVLVKLGYRGTKGTLAMTTITVSFATNIWN